MYKKLTRAIKSPIRAIKYIWYTIDYKLKITSKTKVSGGGERLVINNWCSAKKRDFSSMAHIQRYE
jgi:hypothetical protein